MLHLFFYILLRYYQWSRCEPHSIIRTEARDGERVEYISFLIFQILLELIVRQEISTLFQEDWFYISAPPE